jgi:hypothetical protein
VKVIQVAREVLWKRKRRAKILKIVEAVEEDM